MKKFSLEEQYKKYPGLKREDVLKLMEWNNQQPHLPALDEESILCFYHSCYYSMEMAKQTIDVHFTTKTHYTDLFSNLDFCGDELQTALRVSDVCELKKRTPEGYRVVIGQLKDSDVNKFEFTETLKLYCLCYEQILYENGLSNGDVVLMDMTGVTLGHVTRLGVMTLKKFLYFIQEGAPLRLRGYHFLNAVPFMDKIIALMKPFLTTDFLNIMKVHTTMDTVYQYVPKEILPSDFDGGDKSIRELADKNFARLMENRDYFLKEEKTRRVNEKLRPGKPKTVSDIFGAEGNFKKLDFD